MPMTTSRALRAAARAAQAEAQAVQPQVAQASSTSDGSAHHPLPTAARAAQAQAQAAQAAQAAHPQVAQASSTNDGNAPRPLPTSRQGGQGPALNVMWGIQEHRYPNIGQALDTLLDQATDPSGFWPNGWPDELSPAAHSLASKKDEVVKVSLVHQPLGSSCCYPSCTHATPNHSLRDRCGMASAVTTVVKLLTTCTLSLTSSTHTRSSSAPQWWRPMPTLRLPSQGVGEHLRPPRQGVGEHLLPVGGSLPAPSPCPCPTFSSNAQRPKHPRDALCSWRSAIRRAAQW